MGYDAHVAAYKEIQHRRSKSKGGKKDKKGSKGPKVTERNNWSEVTSKEVRTALVPVLKDSAWPKYLASFSSFQGYHDCVRRIHLANEPWENVSEERQQLVLRAIRCVTSQGLDAWELVLKIRLVAKLTSARVEEMVAKQSELEQGAFITEVKEFFSVPGHVQILHQGQLELPRRRQGRYLHGEFSCLSSVVFCCVLLLSILR